MLSRWAVGPLFIGLPRAGYRLPFVFLTGYAPDRLPTRLRKALVLQKPLASSKLKDAIETILAAEE
jgi:hypothetical protein